MQAERQQLLKQLEDLSSATFEELALRIFHYQAAFNPLYADYIRLLNIQPAQISTLIEIPFLPISFFKNYTIKTGDWPTETIFSSSGTTGQATSQHHVRSTEFYLQNARRCFEQFYGAVSNYCVVALLPSYLEREGSSLVLMADDFIRQSRYPSSNFFLYNTSALIDVLETCRQDNIPVLLLGVSFALLDLAERHPMPLENVIVMETGGMKGRRRELTRQELHHELTTAFQVETIHSEYGMTELLSQAYSQAEGRFYPASTLKILLREITDPLVLQMTERTGVINSIDLANIDTISFIATDDLGRLYPDGSFEVLGRLDASDIRGCNLLVV